VRTSRQRGDELLDWARRSGGWIVEGQMNDELVAPALQPAPLMTRDTNARTIMLGTFEGVAFPSLRVGYLVLPQALARDFIGAIQACGEHAAATVQWALAEFIDRGHMTAHLAKLRERRVQRCEQVRRSLLATLPAGLRAGPMDSGLHLSLHLPPEMADTAVAARLRAQRIFVEPLSVLAWQAGLAHRLNGIVLGYGGLDAPALEHGLRTISQALTEMQGACYPPAGQNT
jgi:GntR family transcriptional regulator/MocR family aminotransferase